jgi:hypothetical protein
MIKGLFRLNNFCPDLVQFLFKALVPISANQFSIGGNFDSICAFSRFILRFTKTKSLAVMLAHAIVNHGYLSIGNIVRIRCYSAFFCGTAQDPQYLFVAYIIYGHEILIRSGVSVQYSGAAHVF